MTREWALIIDKNVFNKGLRKEVSDAISPKRKKKEYLKILISRGGKLEKELQDNRERFIDYKRAGRFYEICNESVERKEQHLKDMDLLSSNDAHIIALAIVSGANVLVTEDGALQCDFLNCNEIDGQSNCTSRKHTKRSIIKKTSPNGKRLKDLINSAKIKYQCCECQINGGGC